MKNSYRVEDDVCYVEVRKVNGQTFEVLLDVSEAESLGNVRIYISTHPTKGTHYARINYSKSRKPQLHRHLTNASKGKVVDHINGNTLDNRLCNLRVVTQAENTQNRNGANKASATGIRGVNWSKQKNMWMARVRVKGMNEFRFYSYDIKEAENAAIEARRKLMPFSEMDKEG